jgi:hypothetical protein
MMKKRLILAITVILFTGTLVGQKAPITFGKIDIEDIKMTVYEPDTTAPAVILADYGRFTSTTLKFTRLLRIKILKKEGYAFADRKYLTISIPIIRAITYNLNGDEIVKDKLKGTDIYTKKLSTDLYETSFAMPNVKEGSVIDIEFVYDGLPYSWEFQEIIPVRHSELILQNSEFLEFNKYFTGYTSLTVSEPSRWVAVNVPAFKPEPSINSYKNYITKFDISLKRVFFPGYNKEYSTTWENIVSLLYYEPTFPSNSTGSLCLSNLVTSLKKSGKQGEELIRAAFEEVKKIKYNGENQLFISEDGLCERYKSGSGNSAEVNFILIQVLNRLNIETVPVVLSTRDNGILSISSPSLNKLNYVIAGIRSREGVRLLDATEEYMPCTLLPERCINGNGRTVTELAQEWVALISPGEERKSITYDLKLEDDFSLTGTITMDLLEYAGYDFRKEYAKYNNKEEYARFLEKENPGLTITEITVNNIDDLYSPVRVVYSVKLEGITIQIDNEVYINPMLFDALKENPFKSLDREYPVSFSRKVDNQVIFRLRLANSSSVVTLPVSSAGKMRNNSVGYTYQVKKEDNSVEVKYSFSIENMEIIQTNYREMRDIYNQIVKKHSEPVIIKIS